MSEHVVYAAPSPEMPCPCESKVIFDECCGADITLPPRGVIIKKNIISDKKCDDMVRYFKTQSNTGAVVAGAKNVIDKQLAQAQRTFRITQVVKQGKWLKKISDLVLNEFSNVVEKDFGQTLLWYQNPGVLLYTSGSHYATHADADVCNPTTRVWQRVIDRDYSLLIYLSSDFEGGRLTFNRFNFSYKPQKGDMILFPSDNRYIHTAEQVTSGSRYAIVSWCSTQESTKVALKPPLDAVQVSIAKSDTSKSNMLGRAITSFNQES